RRPGRPRPAGPRTAGRRAARRRRPRPARARPARRRRRRAAPPRAGPPPPPGSPPQSVAPCPRSLATSAPQTRAGPPARPSRGGGRGAASVDAMDTIPGRAVIDDELVSLDRASLALTDEGVARGDGAFETLGVWDGR